MKRCNDCGQIKEDVEFHLHHDYRRGTAHLSGYCRDCNKIRCKLYHQKNPKSQRYNHLKRKYGVDESEYLRRFMEQGGCCAICRYRALDSEVLHVDHVKGTKIVRGLLCPTCNLHLGGTDKMGFNHDPIRLRRAADYLEGKLYAPTNGGTLEAIMGRN